MRNEINQNKNYNYELSVMKIFYHQHYRIYQQLLSKKIYENKLFYQSKNAQSKELANLIQQSLTDNIGQNKRQPMAIKGAYIMDKVNIPTVIVECGFLSNKSEEEKLKSDVTFRF